ncbi:MAG: hypothetical protein IIB95_05365 [Candidatus Marinimicrobia bacterium]|nr:hypothetical protein [Candidatus Neomarinimicrobiota bacterium]
MYQYSSFDSLGVKIVEGTFSIEYGDTISISGEWDFEKIGNPENIGPQVGEGHLIGTIENDDFFAELKPEWIDNNVHLVGIIEGNKISGNWYYSGFAGIINDGTFIAEK